MVSLTVRNLMLMKRTALLPVVVVILLSVVIGILLIDFAGNETASGKLYTYPVSVGKKTYVVSVLSNYSSAPEVSYSEKSKAVLVDFRGDKENSFCNITIPTDLIWGELSVIDKYYIMSEEHYTKSYNGTHNSIYFAFNHPALVKHFEVKGTQAATP
jgi:hypothetical protein